MAGNTYYSTGTASVSNGGTTVTGSGTAWASVVQAGDLFIVPAQGLVAMITAVASNTSITIDAWPGTTISGAAYKIVFASDAIRQSERARELLEQLSAIDANGRGLFYLFDDGTTDADPGAGNLRLNNATIASATAGYADNLDANGATVSTVLDTWDDTGSSAGRGQLWLRQIADPSIFHAFNVTGSVVDGTGYRKLTLSYIGGYGTFSDADEIMVQFLPVGAGEPGADGTDGGIILTFDDGTSGDPGAGKFRLNNATHASATGLLIDNTDGNAATISGLIDTWDDSTATIKGTVRIVSQADASIWRVYSVSAVADSTGYRTVTVAYVAGNGTLADETACSLFFARTGDNGTSGTNGTNGVDGTGLFSRVRAVAATDITIATALNDGDTLDGVTLATNDLVLVAGQSAPEENGVYVVGVSPARDSSFDTYDEHPGVYVSVMEGTTYADTLWRCTSNKGGTLGSSALVFEEFDAGGDIASESEAEEGTDNAKGMTPLRTHQAYFALESNPNLCFNPAGQSWQNDTTLTAMAHRTPLADGWLWGTDLGTSVWTGTRNADVPDSRYPYSVSVACTTSEASPAAGVDRHIRFAVYGKVFFPVSTANVKVGFWAKSKKTGVHSIACVNEGRTHTYVTEYTIAAADTWEWHEVTIPFGSKAGTWNVDDGYGFGLRFAVVTGSTYRVAAGSWQTGNYTGSTNQVNLGDSTSNYLRICGLQIHAERIPSFILPPFEAVYQEALKQYRVITTNASGANLSIGLAPSANTVNFDMPLGMQMYAPPKISYKGTLNTDVVVYSATAALSGMTGFVSFERSRDMAKFTIEKTGGFSSGAMHYFRLETTSGKLVIDGHLA